MITVFYDGKCGMCRREIALYQRTAPEGVFTWVDITQHSTALDAHGVSYASGLKELHAQDAQGTLHKGVDAFLVIWSAMPGWRLLTRVVAAPLIRPLADLCYRMFAAWRFSRLSHCQLANTAESAKENP